VIVFNVLIYAALLGVLAMGLSNLIGGIRRRKAGDIAGGVFFVLVAVGFGWAMSFVVVQQHQIAASQVDRADAMRCTATILGQQDAHSRINGAELYRFHLRVRIGGKAPYETHSMAVESPYTGGELGTGRTEYACWADRHDPDRVEIRWADPVP
jgi:hypothetical protein